MDRLRWQSVNRIFHAALDLPADDRRAFVLAESNGDPDLCSEVERLLVADRQAESYLESPLLDIRAAAWSGAPQLESGTVLAHRFEILRLIGKGGMGHVYESHDRELGVAVAIKIIRPEISASPEALARFRQEVRLARRITHPNICRTFDLNRDVLVDPDGSTAELFFLTMELLAGETLAARIRRTGAVPAEEARAIALQVAAGLDAAHALGIIHRDVKPANIHLVPAVGSSSSSPRAVITDFGLARLDPLQSAGDLSSATAHSRPMGTLGYMAPEQLEGAAVSPATDIYAFGLVLFEMVTGSRAFPSTTLMNGIAQRLLPPAPSIVPLLSAGWDHAIQGCLRLLPEQRFRSATEAAQAVDGHPISLPPGPPDGRRVSHWRTVRPRWIAVGVLILSFLGIALRLYRLDPKVAAGALIYLAPVRNQTGDRSMQELTELIEAGLRQSSHINLLGQDRAGDILQQMTRSPDSPIDPPTAREIAMRGGAVRVVFPTVTGGRGDYRLDIDIQKPDNTPIRFRDHWTRSFPWHTAGPAGSSEAIPPELLAAIRNSSDWIRYEAGESANDIARLSIPPGDVSTSNWEALQDFDEARHAIARGKKDAAIQMLSSATGHDPHFALAYAELADNLTSLFRTKESLDAYNKAVGLEQEGRLTPRERYFIVGSRASDTGDFQVAADAFKSYTDLYPYDYLGWFYIARPLTELGRSAEALIALHKSFTLQPRSAGTKALIALTDLVAGRPAEARALSRQLTSDGYTDEALYTTGIEDFLEGRFDAAQADFTQLQSSAKSQVYRAFGYALLGSVLAERGRWSDALQAYNRGIDESRQAGDQGSLTMQLLGKAWLLCRLNRCNESFETVDLATTETAGPVHIIAYSSILGAASLSSSASVRAESVRRLKQMIAVVRDKPQDVSMRMAQHRLAGELAAATGDWKRAQAESRLADNLDGVITDRAYLGRLLARAAEHEPQARSATMLRRQAAAAYQRTLDHPANSWHEPWLYLPGFLADEMQSFLDLCSRDIPQDDACRITAEKYHRVRGEAR